MADTEDEKDRSSASAPSQPGPGDWRSQLEGHLREARVMGREITEKLSGAGKRASTEAKDAWKTLEPQIDGAEQTLKQAADGAVESLQGMLSDLKGQLGKLKEKL